MSFGGLNREIIAIGIFMLLFVANRFMGFMRTERPMEEPVRPVSLEEQLSQKVNIAEPKRVVTDIKRVEKKPVVPAGFSFREAYIAFHRGDYVRVKEMCENTDDPRGQVIMAECYWRGLGIPKNDLKAINLFSKSFRAGNADAYAVLGNFQIKQGNFDIGIYNCTQAKNNGSPLGFLICAIAHNTGAWGVSRDEYAAVDYFSKAFDGYYTRGMENDIEACYMLAEFYRNGWGVVADPKKEAYWVRRGDEIRDTGNYKDKR